MSEQQEIKPPGWYDHPATPGAARYWDGARWTDQLAPTAMFQQRRPDPVPDGLLVAGYITMFVLPFVGLVIGIYALAKGESKAGGWILGVSILSGIVGAWYWIDMMTPTTVVGY